MADEQIIIEVVVDNSAARKNIEAQTSDIVALDNEIKSLQKTQKDLSKSNKQNGSEYKANAELIALNRAELAKANTSRRESIKTIGNVSNSLNAQKAALAANKREIGDVNTATKEGRKRFNELTKEISSQTARLKTAEEAQGTFTRSVGNYSGELKDAAAGTSVFGVSLGSVFKLIKGNPIILLVSALAGLVAAFAKTQSGMEFFRKAGAALDVTFGLLSDSVEALGVFLIDAFTNPQQVLDDLVDNIKNGIVFYFTEFIPNAIQKVIDGFGLLGKAAKLIFEGEFAEAAEVGGKAILKLGDGLTDLNPVTALVKTGIDAATEGIVEFAKQVDIAARSAFGLETAMIANEKALADQQVVVAKSIKSQKELNLIVEDTTELTSERIAAAEKFAQVEANQIATSIKLQEERIRLLKEQNDITNSTEEDIQRVRDAEIELANLQAASLERQVTNQNKLNTIRTSEAAARAADIEKQKQEAQSIADQKKKIEEEAAKKSQEDADKEKELEEAKAGARVDLASQSFAAVSQFAEEGSVAAKAAAIGQATVNTYQAITNSLANVPAPFNIASAALTGALGFAQVANIAGIFEDGGITKFANGGLMDGGIFEGASHANGGVKFSVGGKINEAEGGEAIISKRATSMFKPQLSAMNVAGGGKKFANGGIPLAASSTSSIDSAISGENSVANQLSNQVPVQVAVTDINRTQSNVSVKQVRSSI